MANEPITREEILLNAVATGEVANLEPITREEMFLAKLGGADVTTPMPITRKEMFLQKIAESGGGGSGGVVVCNEAEVSKGTTISSLEGLKVKFPSVESIARDAFKECDNLTFVDLPSAINIDYGSFSHCYNLQSINMPKVIIVGNGAFSYSGIRSVELPVATDIGLNAFTNCNVLGYASLTSAVTIGERAFAGCGSLKSVDIPVATAIKENAFDGCISLKSIDLPVTSSIGGFAFYLCSKLTACILRTTETVCVTALSAFDDTPISTGKGHIYVPASMFDAYRAAYEPTFVEGGMDGFFDILFRKIEDYPEICG